MITSTRGFPVSGSSDASVVGRGNYTRRLLFVVGIDKYKSWPRLSNAKHDAEGVSELLQSSYGFELAAAVYDRDATRDGIEAAFRLKVAEIAEADDLVVFFFAGHGHTERLPSDKAAGVSGARGSA